MDRVPPLTTTEWRGFLKSYSSEFLGSRFLREMETERRAEYFLSDAQRSAVWLGYEPASEDEILGAEQRLGVRLPPSYRNFLLTSDGWSTISYSIDLLAIAEVGWLRELESELLTSWSEPGTEYFANQIRMLERCLLISNDNGGSGQLLLLHADDLADDGEWTAYEWWPGDGDDPEPYDSFAVLVASMWDDVDDDDR